MDKNKEKNLLSSKFTIQDVKDPRSTYNSVNSCTTTS